MRCEERVSGPLVLLENGMLESICTDTGALFYVVDKIDTEPVARIAV